jgi:hypothetical protein
MLFPNFYVPSVGVKIVAVFLRTRMSLSHLGGHEQNFPQIFRRFVSENQIRNAPGRFALKTASGARTSASRPGKSKMV